MTQTATFSSEIFNGLIQSYLIYALNKLHILEYLSFHNKATFSQLTADLSLLQKPAECLLGLAQSCGIVQEENAEYSLTALGQEVSAMSGFFTWAIGGYGQLLSSLDSFCTSQPNIRSLIKGEWVAKGSDECYHQLMKATLSKALASISCSHLADLGCGNAGKLIEFAQENPAFRGLGIDVNVDAIELARANVRSQGLEGRIDLISANVLDTVHSSHSFPEITTVSCFMMMHDLFNLQKDAVSIFQQLRKTFPNVRYFVIGDTMAAAKNQLSRCEERPIFTMGFELVHQMLDVKLFELDYYLDVFKRSDLLIEQIMPFGVPNTYLFILKVPA